jgi:hypothetical protein
MARLMRSMDVQWTSQNPWEPTLTLNDPRMISSTPRRPFAV